MLDVATQHPRSVPPSGAPVASAGRRADVLGAAVAALLALAVAAWTLQLWRAHLSVPFRYGVTDDTKFYLALIKGIADHGWFITNHDLGAPFGQQLFDYPQGADDLNLLIVKALTVVLSGPTGVIDVFYLLTYPLDALTAYVVMRRLGLSIPVAIVGSVLFAVLPYHFWRGDSHLFLSSYFALPLVVYLFVAVLDGRPLFGRRAPPARGPTAWLTARTGWTALMCVVIASTGLYYAVFGLVLVAASVLLALLAGRGRRAALPGVAAVALIGIVLVINLAPTVLYEAKHGSNVELQHSAGVGDDLAMSPSYLVLPPLQDRIAPLRSITTRYAAQTPPHGYCEQCYESVGTVGDVGLLWLGLVVLGMVLGGSLLRARAPLHRWLALAAAVSVGIGATGGLSSLSRVFLTGDIRAWNRLSVVVAFVALVAVGLLLDGALARVRAGGGRRGTVAGALILLGVLAFGIADQTSAYFRPNYSADAREYHSDSRFVAEIEDRMPAGADIFELPYVPYPEGYQPFQATDQTFPFSNAINFEYELVRGYLHSEGLRWSFGATKGRAADWAGQLAAKPVGTAVTGAAVAGFDGLWIDPRGYPGQRPALERELGRLLRERPLVSADNDLLFYDLRPLAARLRAAHPAAQLAAVRAAVLHPLRLTCATGRLTIANPASSARTAVLDATLPTRHAPVRVSVSGGPATTVTGTQLRMAMRLAPGTTAISLSAAAAPVRLFAPTVQQGVLSTVSGPSAGGLRTGVLGPPCASVATR
jgi:phosphoglycerol transferase